MILGEGRIRTSCLIKSSSKKRRFNLSLFYLWFQLTFSGLAKVAIFTTNVDAENQTLINHKCVCGALNRHFCQTRVSGSCFLSCRVKLALILCQVLPLCFVSSVKTFVLRPLLRQQVESSCYKLD